MAYQVDIQVGELSWSLVEADGEITDGLAVLSGLSTGWEIPDGIWPNQPAVMQASLSLNVPAFADVDALVDVVDGDICTIEVRAVEAGPIIASFYGDVTDYKARSRPGPRTGVTIGVAAVDYTVRAAEVSSNPYPLGINLDGFPEVDVASQVWFTGGLAQGSYDSSSDPAAVLTDPLPWTLPGPHGMPRTTGLYDHVNVRDFIVNTLLLQSVDNGVGRSRLVLSPVVDPDGSLHTDWTSGGTHSFTVDTIHNVLDYGDVIEIPAAAVRRDDIEWSNVKGQQLGKVRGSPGWRTDDGEGNAIDMLPEATVDYGFGAEPHNVTQEINFLKVYEADAQAVVDFYAANAFEAWQLDRVTVEITRAEITADIPAGLFPDWKAPEADPARSSCYTQVVKIPGVSPTRHPKAGVSILGVLVGARISIAVGEITLELKLRRPLGVYEGVDP